MTLPKGLFNHICEELEQNDVDFTVHEDYSGRGMYGDICVGFSSENVMAVVFRLGMVIAELTNNDNPNEDWTDWLEDNKYSLCDLFTRGITDSLGLKTIVYFKGLQVENSQEDDSGGEEDDE